MKMDFSKWHFLSSEQQKILWLMFNNGQKINYKEQDVFKNEKSFNKSMQILENAKIVKMTDYKFYPEYGLTWNGRKLCQWKIIPLGVKNE